MADSREHSVPQGQLGPGGDIQTNDGLAELSSQEISNALLRTSLKGEILRVDRSSVRQCLANQRACSQVEGNVGYLQSYQTPCGSKTLPVSELVQ